MTLQPVIYIHKTFSNNFFSPSLLTGKNLLKKIKIISFGPLTTQYADITLATKF